MSAEVAKNEFININDFPKCTHELLKWLIKKNNNELNNLLTRRK